MSGTGDSSAVNGGGCEIMLFGVRVVVDSMRKSVSLNNLSQYEQPQDNSSNCNNNNNKDDVAAAGYASADDGVHNNSSRASRERKRGVPWTEEEHKLFLLGLQKVGKGDWRGISRNFVKTRTPTQVASHAQKYFLRRSNLNRRRRRSSLFDITTDSSYPLLPPTPAETSNKSGGFSMMPALPVVLPVPIENPMENLTLGQNSQRTAGEATRLIRPVPVLPAAQPSSTVSDLNLNLNLAVDPPPLSQRESSSRHSAFQVMQTFNNGDSNSIISVA
ncbi:HTH myb-type domain-containing protein [Citrus sinensis]|nr:HTH myb-type domain-containing protein [Citrus sinensis]